MCSEFPHLPTKSRREIWGTRVRLESYIRLSVERRLAALRSEGGQGRRRPHTAFCLEEASRRMLEREVTEHADRGKGRAGGL
jgi:hypothetical protein